MNASDYITLQGGLTLPLAALRLAWDLESRGLRLTVDGVELVVGPRHQLTDDDRVQIRTWKDHLKAIAAIEAQVVVQ